MSSGDEALADRAKNGHLQRSHMETIADLLKVGADDAIALGAPERTPHLTYCELRRLVGAITHDLNALGIGRDDRVVLVLPNGPEAAAAFVSVAACSTAAPLSPGLTADELKFNLSDLRAKALVIQEGIRSPAREVAAQLGVKILELVPEPARATGAFALKPSQRDGAMAEKGGPAGPEDVALVLHTSGSTSRPKIVPLLQRNVTASARNIQRSLQLTADDVCLNIMPLFHIHGLMAAVLASLAAGAQVSCTTGFNALRFFHWLDE
ncbi:MAG TPA: AMP-binding protein, partial [Myxococcaceae bacterium]|nr:AMP-binding protein [Myxococcaceae bacterium]